MVLVWLRVSPHPSTGPCTHHEHHEHLVDIETGEVHEFYNEELETLKTEIAREMGYDLIDHRLELYGKKRKS